MPAPATTLEPTANWAAHPGLLRCVACGDGTPEPGAGADAPLVCDRCGATYPIRDGVLVGFTGAAATPVFIAGTRRDREDEFAVVRAGLNFKFGTW